jgi:PKD repeat protein
MEYPTSIRYFFAFNVLTVLNYIRLIPFRAILLFFLFILLWEVAFGQSPSADFNIDNGCLNENLKILNNSTNANSFSWDFCADDFSNLRDFNDAVAINQIGYGTGFKLVEDNGQWFGFALGWYSDKLFRLEFGDSPLNTPSIVDLGDPLNILAFPQNIEIVKQNGSWFGLVTNLDNGAGIRLLDFGSSLLNSPTTTNLGTFGTSDRIWDCKVVKEDANFILVFAERGTNKIVRVNFRDSFYNDTSGHVYTNVIVGPSAINGLDIVWTGSSWKVLATSNGSNQIYQIDFGLSLLGTPTVEGFNSSVVDKPYRVDIVQQADEFFVIVSGETAGDIRIFNYHDFNPTNTPSVLPHTSISGLIGIDACRFKGESLLLGVGTTAFLKRAIFESDCGANILYSSESFPPPLSFSTSGARKIEMIAKNTVNGEDDFKVRDITILNKPAPDVNFLSQNVCANHNVSFTPLHLSTDITNYSWSFGDFQYSTDPNPTHQFSLSGGYNVSLQVVAQNSCNNYVEKIIKLYNAPSTSFTSPSGLICTNNEFTFTNNTPDNFDGNLSYEWSVDGITKETARDLKYTFTSGGDQSIKLKTSIPGCSTELTQIINGVQTGPTIDFTFTGKCENESVLFTNNSSGSIASYSWDFGNSNTSSEVSPTQTFSAKGNYLISLQTNGVNGCVSNLSKNLTIYSKPQPNFSLNLPPFSCAGSLSQFTNSTPTLTDSNISWSWNFGDTANGTSTARDPGYIYSAAGDYNVSLVAKTNFGCEATVQKSVTISSSPTPSFTNAPACLNQGTKFTDGSGANIKSWLWNIGTSTYSFNNPTHIFSASGPHTVSLAVTANNNCIATASKTVTVTVPVSINFSSQNLCEDQPTIFQDTTPTNADAPASWSWDIGGLTAKTGASTTYTFSASATYPIKLTSTRQSGCIYSLTKNVAITATPIAKFSPSPEWGTPPLSVQFLNESTGANTYQWKFNDKDNSTSTLLSPTFQFGEVGEYVVDLTATSAQGCSNTFSNKVSVVIPSLDVDLKELTLIKDETSGAYQMMVTIKNLSNYPLDKINVLVFISGNATIRETINTRIIPNGEITKLLSNQIIAGASTTYLCAELDVSNDRDELNNKKCEPLDAKPVVFSPYPNPSNGSFQFDWIAAEKEEANFEILNSMGQIVLQQTVTATQKGLNQIQVDLRAFSGGTFYFKFASASVTKILPISIVR